jgi:superfamily I DNA and/or RNA helicase
MCVQATQVLTSCCLVDEKMRAFRLPTLAELRKKRVIVCTTIASAFLLRYEGHELQSPVPITHVLIDEAGQAPLLEALLPMLLADAATGSVCLAGDPCQLGPVIRSPVAAEAGLGESMLERLVGYYEALPTGLSAAAMMVLLVRNYRSHANLLRLPSDLFYGSALQAAADQQATAPPAWSVLGTARAFCLSLF